MHSHGSLKVQMVFRTQVAPVWLQDRRAVRGGGGEGEELGHGEGEGGGGRSAGPAWAPPAPPQGLC